MLLQQSTREPAKLRSLLHGKGPEVFASPRVEVEPGFYHVSESCKVGSLCVYITPLGFDVVPEVNGMASMSSSLIHCDWRPAQPWLPVVRS